MLIMPLNPHQDPHFLRRNIGTVPFCFLEKKCLKKSMKTLSKWPRFFKRVQALSCNSISVELSETIQYIFFERYKKSGRYRHHIRVDLSTFSWIRKTVIRQSGVRYTVQ